MQTIIDTVELSLAGLYDKAELYAVTKSLCLELLGLSQTDYWLKRRLEPDSHRDAVLAVALGRLKTGEPLQYVLGTAQFMGHEFKVNSSVLVPRPETALLVELASACGNGRGGRLLDIGTGSGCIAVTLALLLENWDVAAWDISLAALETARANAGSNAARVHFEQHDILNWRSIRQDTACGFDMIVSNPPYVTESEAAAMSHTVLDYEPHIALFVPDSDPLRFYREIALFGHRALAAGGMLFFEINPLFVDELTNMLARMSYVDIKVHTDIYGKHRVLSAQLDKTT